MPIIGAHVSSATSLELSFDRAQKIGAECTQIFVSPPQQWLQTKHPEEEINRYKSKRTETNCEPNFIHGSYLINLAAEDPAHLEKSINWLKYAMKMAEELGIDGVIFHTGSHKGRGFEQVLPQIVKSLNVILSDSEEYKEKSDPSASPQDDKKKPYLILENSAGAGGSIGSKFSELGKILKKTNDQRLKICLDTCHAYASGYDLKTLVGLKSTLEEFEEEVGMENLVVLHANDSKFDLGSGKDRHENIGEGFIGREGFGNLLKNPRLKDLPFILEVPGIDGSGPDDENIQTLKSLIS